MSELRRSRALDGRALATSIRATLRRSRVPRIAATVAIGVIAGHAVGQARAESQAARDQWGQVAEVWVMRRHLDAGEMIGPDDIARRHLPVIAVPADPTRTDPTGSWARDTMVAGEVVHDARLQPSASGPIAARLPRGRVALTLEGGAALAIGDRIDLHGLLTGERLAAGAEVVGVDDSRFTAALERTAVDAVVRALTTGGVVPVIVG